MDIGRFLRNEKEMTEFWAFSILEARKLGFRDVLERRDMMPSEFTGDRAKAWKRGRKDGLQYQKHYSKIEACKPIRES